MPQQQVVHLEEAQLSTPTSTYVWCVWVCVCVLSDDETWVGFSSGLLPTDWKKLEEPAVFMTSAEHTAILIATSLLQGEKIGYLRASTPPLTSFLSLLLILPHLLLFPPCSPSHLTEFHFVELSSSCLITPLFGVLFYLCVLLPFCSLRRHLCRRAVVETEKNASRG